MGAPGSGDDPSRNVAYSGPLPVLWGDSGSPFIARLFGDLFPRNH